MPGTEFDRLARKSAAMLELQDEMNRRVDEDWIRRDRAWYRAIWIECAELMDHYGGWKWWKHSGPTDVGQVLLEIVDIWHFGLSARIRPDQSFAETGRQIAAEWLAPVPSRGFLIDVEAMAAAAVAERRFAVPVVPILLEQIGLDFDDLYRSYVGKNVLNVFRQDRGYRSGEYRKQWSGREDNVHLAEIVDVLDADDPDYRGRLYGELERRYRLDENPGAG
ncbi:MAG: dUTP diphosphatase [Gammaproteobacteria bacterium]